MYKYPSVSLLKDIHITNRFSDKEYVNALAEELMITLQSFKVNCKITACRITPFAIMFDVMPEPGVSVKNFRNLRTDLEVHTASPVEIMERGEGEYTIGLAIKNWDRPLIGLREVLESNEFKIDSEKYTIPIAVGVDVFGRPFSFDLAETPHLLVAGTTGSGKSVFLNDVVLSILFNKTPDEVQLIMIDPKMVEFTPYNGIPHLLRPVIYDTKHSLEALDWANQEMMRRYNLFSQISVRTIESFNDKVSKNIKLEMSNPELKQLPRIVIVVDEYMEMMFEAKKELEEYITRLARLGRASGVHLVLATQRPSSDVVTSSIKANIPCRASFTVIDWRESKTILDRTGAERLLGSGDMLFSSAESAVPVHAQAAFVSNEEVDSIIETVRRNNPSRFNTGFLNIIENRIQELTAYIPNEETDPLLVETARWAVQNEKVTSGAIQRQFSIGFNRASYLIDQLLYWGILGNTENVNIKVPVKSIEEVEEMISNQLL